MSLDPFIVQNIRSASRNMVRELGFMQATLANTDLSPSAVHTLIEISTQEAMTAAQLAIELKLNKSSVSRMIAKLIQSGEIVESASDDDGRTKQLTLTKQGQQTVSKIHDYGQMQVSNAISSLNLAQQQIVVQGLSNYAEALRAYRLGTQSTTDSPIQIKEGYLSGLIGRVTEMHASFYSTHSGFGQFFESQVATGLAEFTGRLTEPCNKIWTATYNDHIVGSVAIDGQDLDNNEAHLRWFILDDGYRGNGIGGKLLAEAVAFCDRQDFEAIQLWTFKGLEAARTLYESFGFELTHEEQGSQWGTRVTEQKFTRRKKCPLSSKRVSR